MRGSASGALGRGKRSAAISSASAAISSSTSARVANLPMPARDADRVDLEAQLVARHHLPPEARVVDAGEEEQRVAAGAGARRLVGEDRRRLRQRLDDQHAGHHREAGKCPWKNGSFIVTFFSARINLPGSHASDAVDAAGTDTGAAGTA